MAEDTLFDILDKDKDDADDNLLCKYLLKCSINDLKSQIKAMSRKAKGPTQLRQILSSLNKEDVLNRTESLRIELSLTIISEVFTNSSIPNANALKYLDFIELDNFKDKSLGRIYEKCRHYLEQESPTSFRWLPFFGQLLSVIQSKELFKQNDEGDEESGLKFVENCVRDICSFNWDLDLVTGICSLLKVILNAIIMSSISFHLFRT